jgi:hypothetical protein
MSTYNPKIFNNVDSLGEFDEIKNREQTRLLDINEDECTIYEDFDSLTPIFIEESNLHKEMEKLLWKSYSIRRGKRDE